jgi:hypothetical protein
MVIGVRGELLVDGEDGWQPARLIPTSGIKGVEEQEKRGTSALLSVMVAVPEFSRVLLKKVGAPAGELKTYIEPEFTLESGQKIRPDGAMIIRRGSTVWKALVEVKAGTNELRADQIEAYLDLARDRGFDGVITISNQLAAAVDNSPVAVDRRKTRRTGLFHWSWVEILTEAVMQREHRGISDPDQAWILGELIAYLKHPQSGAMQFQDMGPHWVATRDAAREGMLHASDVGVSEVVSKWDQFIEYLCLHLASELGVEVTHVLSKQERDDPSSRRQSLVRQLVQTKSLSGAIRIKNAVNPLTLTAALDNRTTTASVEIDAPSMGRAVTRVNWLTRQLKDAPERTLVACRFVGVRESNSSRLVDLRANPATLLLADKQRAPRAFTISFMKEMGTKRSGVSGSFIGEATELLLSFYRTTVQGLRSHSAVAPKLPQTRDALDVSNQPENIVEQSADLEAEEASRSLAVVLVQEPDQDR